MHEFHFETEERSLGGATVAALNCAPWDAWYCVRTYARRERIAAAQLRRYSDIEVFLPCIRYERPLRSARVWMTEALFQNYLFARFDLAACGRKIRHAHAVRDVVHFGTRFPIIPEMVIEELRSAMGQDETRVIASSFDPGEEVRIAGGPFHDLEAVVIRAMPSQQRVAVLLDFLGRQTKVELDDTQLTSVVEGSRRAEVVCSAAALDQENERTSLSSRCRVAQPEN
jgi:transcriptional antiterminator RfaH